jgi:hypothetical protein
LTQKPEECNTIIRQWFEGQGLVAKKKRESAL